MTILAFDRIRDRRMGAPLSFTEAEALAEQWARGEDGWLREDLRFRPTPWGRWILSDRYLINDLLVRTLQEGVSELSLAEQLDILSKVIGRPTACCPADPRLRLDGDRVRLAPSELTTDPLLESVEPYQQYTTHLPVYSLKAAAASLPAGEWGSGAESQYVEVQGWLRVESPSRPLTRRMFVAQVRGHSMDGGTRPIEDGAWAVFEFTFHEGATYDSGASQPTVLVRGEFADPETGSYAVKRWDRGAPEIRLVSNNLDKKRYPDIVIPRDAADHLRVVATFGRVLAPSDYARRPKPLRHPGRRVLKGASGLAEVGTRLDKRIEAFFEGNPLPDDELDASPPLGWQARIICLAPSSGGPHLEIGPLVGLPPFVKKLRAIGTGWDSILLVTNARQRPVRLTLPPGTGPWKWEAVGFEDEVDLDLARLDAEALPENAVSVFRVDADDVGQHQSGTTLAPGQCYRILIPPPFGDVAGEALADGWHLWTLDMSVPPEPSTREQLRTLGLGLGAAWPRLEWAGCPPAAWKTTPRGEAHPVFETGTEVWFQAHGLPSEGDEAAMVFLRGPDGTERFELLSVREALVSLGALPAGRYACALLHPRTDVKATTLLFEVEAGATRHVAAAWSVRRDVEDEDAEPFSHLQISAPSGWPVALCWRVIGEVPLATLHADEAHHLDLSSALPHVAERARQARIADLVVDLGELGNEALPHELRPTVESIRQKLQRIWNQRQDKVRGQDGAWLVLVPRWFRPIIELFGYQLQDLPQGALPDAEQGLAAWRLLVDERSGGEIRRRPARVLVLTTDLEATLQRQRNWLDQACDLADVREAILSDGVRWTTHRKGSRLRRRVWDISMDMLGDTLTELLADLGEGI